MTPFRRLTELTRHLHAILGAPGLMIGGFSVLSFVFGLCVFAREYDRPRQTGRHAIHRIVGNWVRVSDDLGLTLVDFVDLWCDADDAEKPSRRDMLRQFLGHLGDELERQSERFPLIHVVSMELAAPGSPSLARWKAPAAPESSETEVFDRIPLSDSRADSPGVELRVRYRIAPTFDAAARGLEKSYRRLLLALLGLSGFSLLCLGYMILHAQALSERVAREAAQEATLDLADRTCHELGNGIFVLANESRNLAGHLDLIERFVAEDPQAREVAARRSGIDPELAARWQHALRREYSSRGIDPDLEIRGSVAIARHVCHQIDVCSEYIRMTVRELDGFLKRSALPVALETVDVGVCFDEALALLLPRFDAADVRVVRHFEGDGPPAARADRRLLIHALVNLMKNAFEALSVPRAGEPPELTLSARREGKTVWISVADNGPGLTPGAHRHVFNDRYSTKGPGRGRGLAIVRESVLVQDGEIDVRDRPGGGTEFRIALPVATGAVGRPPESDGLPG